jgi:hypothetical protein
MSPEATMTGSPEEDGVGVGVRVGVGVSVAVGNGVGVAEDVGVGPGVIVPVGVVVCVGEPPVEVHVTINVGGVVVLLDA